MAGLLPADVVRTSHAFHSFVEDATNIDAGDESVMVHFTEALPVAAKVVVGVDGLFSPVHIN